MDETSDLGLCKPECGEWRPLSNTQVEVLTIVTLISGIHPWSYLLLSSSDTLLHTLQNNVSTHAYIDNVVQKGNSF